MMKPAKLRALSWGADLPLPGHYIKSARGRTAYLVLGVVRAEPGRRHVAVFNCERTPASTLPADAVVHGWRWAAR